MASSRSGGSPGAMNCGKTVTKITPALGLRRLFSMPCPRAVRSRKGRLAVGSSAPGAVTHGPPGGGGPCPPRARERALAKAAEERPQAQIAEIGGTHQLEDREADGRGLEQDGHAQPGGAAPARAPAADSQGREGGGPAA